MISATKILSHQLVGALSSRFNIELTAELNPSLQLHFIIKLYTRYILYSSISPSCLQNKFVYQLTIGVSLYRPDAQSQCMLVGGRNLRGKWIKTKYMQHNPAYMSAICISKTLYEIKKMCSQKFLVGWFLDLAGPGWIAVVDPAQLYLHIVWCAHIVSDD